MSKIHEDTKQPPVIGEREYVRFSTAEAMFEVSKATIYRLAAKGSIRLVKVGSATLVDVASFRAFFGSQPSVTIRRSAAA